MIAKIKAKYKHKWLKSIKYIYSFNTLGEELDYVFVSCGGGGLIGGIALYLKYLK